MNLAHRKSQVEDTGRGDHHDREADQRSALQRSDSFSKTKKHSKKEGFKLPNAVTNFDWSKLNDSVKNLGESVKNLRVPESVKNLPESVKNLPDTVKNLDWSQLNECVKNLNESVKNLKWNETFIDSFSKLQSQLNPDQWRKVGMATALMAFVHIMTHTLLSPAHHLGVRRHLASVQNTVSPQHDSPWFRMAQAGQRAEQGINDFFQDDSRALDNGVPFGGTEESTPLLTKRLARRIALCHDSPKEECVLRVAFVGSTQMMGHDMHYKDSFPFQTEQRLRPVADAAGLKLVVTNHAFDNEHSKEGPQSTHMCIGNLVGPQVDVIAWDLDASMQGAPQAQFEAFVRWAFQSQPAMILVNRGGPHARSRRGKRKSVVNVAPMHEADIWLDDPDNMPEPRDEDYVGSEVWKARWEDGRNAFWNDIVETYTPYVDFAAVDPTGSLWTLDHLPAFSNAALDAGKALPLMDCGKEHPAPCDQIPPFIQSKLDRKNHSLDDFPPELLEGGDFCGANTGCRNIIYGGRRSHVLRGELNALPIVRSLRYAATILASPSKQLDLVLKADEDAAATQIRALSLKFSSLPPPTHCSDVFCNLFPTCHSSYLPNLGLSLSDAFLTHNNTTPRMGAAHFADDPEWSVENLDKRAAPMGNVDRKYAFRLTAGDGKPHPIRVDGNLTGELEPLDTASVEIAFSMTGMGPVVLCEPPCFLDQCPTKRRMPLLPHVTLELDGHKLEQLGPSAVEVGGPFCQTITDHVPAGDHVLRISAITHAPFHVMVSHLITFS